MAESSVWSVTVGDVAVHGLVDIAELAVERREFFPHFDLGGHRDSWFARPPFARPESDTLVLTIQSFLVICRETVILVDCGVGDGKSRERRAFDRRTSGSMYEMRSLGIDLDDVDYVVITHLHVDHVGWATSWDGSAWRPTFANARYVIPAADLEYWRGEEGRALMTRTGDYLADSVEPVVDSHRVLTADPNDVLPPEVRVENAAGHTPGNTLVRIESRGELAVLCGDVVHSPLQCAFPDVNSRYCCEAPAARTVRRNVLAEVSKRRGLLVPAHFPPPTAGRLREDGRGYVFSFVPERDPRP